MNMFREWRVSKLFFHIDLLSEMLISQCIALLCLDICLLLSILFYFSTKVNEGKETRRKKWKQTTIKNQNLISAEANNFIFLCSQHLIWFLICLWGAFLRKRAYDSFVSTVCFFYSSCVWRKRKTKNQHQHTFPCWRCVCLEKQWQKSRGISDFTDWANLCGLLGKLGTYGH